MQVATPLYPSLSRGRASMPQIIDFRGLGRSYHRKPAAYGTRDICHRLTVYATGLNFIQRALKGGRLKGWAGMPIHTAEVGLKHG